MIGCSLLFCMCEIDCSVYRLLQTQSLIQPKKTPAYKDFNGESCFINEARMQLISLKQLPKSKSLNHTFFFVVVVVVAKGKPCMDEHFYCDISMKKLNMEASTSSCSMFKHTSLCCQIIP